MARINSVLVPVLTAGMLLTASNLSNTPARHTGAPMPITQGRYILGDEFCDVKLQGNGMWRYSCGLLKDQTRYRMVGAGNTLVLYDDGIGVFIVLPPELTRGEVDTDPRAVSTASPLGEAWVSDYRNTKERVVKPENLDKK